MPIVVAPQLLNEPFTMSVSTKVGPTMHARTKARATQLGISMAELMRRAIAAYL